MHSIALSWCNFLKNDCFFAVANRFRFIRIIKQQLFGRFWDWLADFLTLISNSINFKKKILSLLYFLLTLYSIFTQLVRKFDPICLLRTLLYSILRRSIFTHTLGKIHFLLCFACFINLWQTLEESLSGHIFIERSQGGQKCPKTTNWH